MIKTRLFTLLSATAFHNNGSTWKLDADGKIEMKDGNPILVDSTGKETTIDQNAISRLNAEAKQHREQKEAAEAKLKAFEGLDAEKARKAIETVEKIDAKQLMDAGKVDELKAQITQQFTAQINEKDKAYNDLQSKYENMQIGNIFNGSEFLRENVALPLDMVEAYFRSNFKIENGNIAAYYRDGNPVMSKESGSIGQNAKPDEALRLLIEAHPQKDIILKATDANGSGNNGGGGARGGGRVVKRADLEKLSPAQQAETSAKVRAGEIQLVD